MYAMAQGECIKNVHTLGEGGDLQQCGKKWTGGGKGLICKCERPLQSLYERRMQLRAIFYLLSLNFFQSLAWPQRL